ncbi:MAG: hypothetical protein ACKVPX_02760 [Myxococcaceae bacterium]
MLYKVTPMLAPEPEKPKKARGSGVPRKRRASAVYDRDGQEVLVSLMCLKCKQVKPLPQFGLRKMADGAIRNQPWCRSCRSQAGSKKSQRAVTPVLVPVQAEAEAAALALAEVEALHEGELGEPLAEASGTVT